MIVWLASYPRSGNSLVRSLLNQVFGLQNFSQYQDRGSKSPQRSPTGSLCSESSFEKLFLHARRSRRGFLIKTHHPPLDDSPAIVVTRDGRSSIVSYSHFLRDIDGVDVSIRSVIRGEVGIGMWSQTLADWNPFIRPQTLLLRFEDILAEPDRVTDLISEFLQIEPVQTWENPFEELRSKSPKIFRTGGNQVNLKELQPVDEELFWQYHRPWMERLGYCETDRVFRSGMTCRPAALPDRWLGVADAVDKAYQLPPDKDSSQPFPPGETVYHRLFEKDRQIAELQQQLTEKEAIIKHSQRWIWKKWRRAG